MSEVFINVNALLRYLLNDVPEQADQIESLLGEAERGEVRLVTHAHIIAELVWVLASFYKVSRQQVRQQVEAIIHTPGLEVDERTLVLSALRDYDEKNVAYIDAYTAAWMAARGMSEIATFDKHFKRYSNLALRLISQK